MSDNFSGVRNEGEVLNQSETVRECPTRTFACSKDVDNKAENVDGNGRRVGEYYFLLGRRYRWITNCRLSTRCRLSRLSSGSRSGRCSRCFD